MATKFSKFVQMVILNKSIAFDITSPVGGATILRDESCSLEVLNLNLFFSHTTMTHKKMKRKIEHCS